MIRFFVVLLFSMAWQTAARADVVGVWPRFSDRTTDAATVIAGVLLALGFVALGFRIARRGKRGERSR